MRKSILILKSLLLSALLATTAFAAQKVNINSADAATLDRVLVGIGPSKAEAIVAYRKANGAFRSADQLASVKGIGLSTIEKNRDRIVVAGGAPAAPTKAGAAAKPTAARPAAKPAARPASGG
ncbi:ComEA family DNA-binding protein [Arenimonas sp.]|uniref:ComEA family DNA-binding protein n=1 Tax=Arenimonas sp. TaxID=1872635 RepID=UPI0039E729EB